MLAVGGLVLRARECVSPDEAVPIRSLVTGRLASGGDRTRNPLRRKRACSHYTTQPTIIICISDAKYKQVLSIISIMYY